MESEDRKQELLAAFTKGYNALAEFNNILVDMTHEKRDELEKAELEGDAQENVVTFALNSAQIVAKLSVVRSTLLDIHHQLGHTVFDQCWKHTEVGDEGKPANPAQSLQEALEAAMDGNAHVEIASFDLGKMEDGPMKSKLNDFIEKIQSKKR